MGSVYLGHYFLIDMDNYYNACPFLPKDGQDRLIFIIHEQKWAWRGDLWFNCPYNTQIIGLFDVFELWTKEYITHPRLLSQRKVNFDSPVYGKNLLIETWNMHKSSSTLLRAHDSLQGQIWL